MMPEKTVKDNMFEKKITKCKVKQNFNWKGNTKITHPILNELNNFNKYFVLSIVECAFFEQFIMKVKN